MECNCIAKNSCSHMKELASRCFKEQIVRCNDASKVMVYFLSKHTALCTRSMRSLSLCLSLSLPLYRQSADATGGRAMHSACSFVLHEGFRDYTLSPVTNRWKPLGTRSFPRDQQVEDARGCVADDSETRPAKKDGSNRKEVGRWTIRELLLFQLVPELWNSQSPVAREPNNVSA